MPLSTKPEPRPKIVMDTNIVVSAGLEKLGHSFKIFEMVSGAIIENFTTVEILEEIRDVFQREEITRRIPENDRNFIISVYEQKSILVKPAKKPKIVAEDPKDDKFIHCAITAKAKYIVSGDQHLLKLKQHHKIQILKPKEFLDTVKMGRR